MSDEVAAERLADVRKAVHSKHGAITALCQEMNRLTSTTISRQAVSRWLADDPKKRQEPKFGIAIILLQAAENLNIK